MFYYAYNLNMCLNLETMPSQEINGSPSKIIFKRRQFQKPNKMTVYNGTNIAE